METITSGGGRGSFIKIFKNKAVWLAILVLAVGGYFWYKSRASTSAKVQYVTGAAAKGTLTVGVSGTGQVAAQNQLDIKPSGSAKIVEVGVAQGQQVKAGQRIVVLDQTTAANTIAQARASLASAQANYDSVVAGATDLDLKLAKASVDSAELSLTKAKNDYTYTKAQQDQAVNKAYTAYLNNSLTAVPSSGNNASVTITVSGSYQGPEQGQYTINTYTTGAGIYYSVSGLDGGASGPIILGGPAVPLGNKGLYMAFSSTGTLYPSNTWTVSLPNPQANNYTTTNNDYQSAILSRQQAIQNAQNSIDSAQQALNNAQLQLEQKQRGSTNAQVEQAAAQLVNAKAQLQTAQTQYQNNIITAPFDGVIAQLSAKVGDQVNGGTAAAGSTNLATLITKQKIANITLNEVDVAKIKVGDKATMTFDAIDGLDMTGTVAQIDSIGTVSQGVVTYTVKISIDTDDDRIKPGMSVSVNIITNVKTDVLIVPSSAVKTSGTTSYVQALDKSGQPYNINVQTGLSNDSETEITSGLSDGQEIITQTITTSSASGSSAARTTGGNATFGGLGGAVRINR